MRQLCVASMSGSSRCSCQALALPGLLLLSACAAHHHQGSCVLSSLGVLVPQDLARANLERAERPWVLVLGHRPQYCAVAGPDGRCDAEHEASRLVRPGLTASLWCLRQADMHQAALQLPPLASSLGSTSIVSARLRTLPAACMPYCSQAQALLAAGHPLVLPPVGPPLQPHACSQRSHLSHRGALPPLWGGHTAPCQLSTLLSRNFCWQAVSEAAYAQVDLAMYGHVHDYEHFFPAYDLQAYPGLDLSVHMDPPATVHVTSGAALLWLLASQVHPAAQAARTQCGRQAPVMLPHSTHLCRSRRQLRDGAGRPATAAGALQHCEHTMVQLPVW